MELEKYSYSRYGDCAPALVKNIYQEYNLPNHFLYTQFAKYGFDLERKTGTVTQLEPFLFKFGIKAKKTFVNWENVINKIDSSLKSKKMVVIYTKTKVFPDEGGHVYLITGIESAKKKEANSFAISLNKIEAYRCIGRWLGNYPHEPSTLLCGYYMAANDPGNLFFESHELRNSVESYITKETVLYDLGLMDASVPYKEKVNFIYIINGIQVNLDFLNLKIYKPFPGLRKKLRELYFPKAGRLIMDNNNSIELTKLFVENLKKHEPLLVKNLSGDFYKYSHKIRGSERAKIEAKHVIDYGQNKLSLAFTMRIDEGVDIKAVKYLIEQHVIHNQLRAEGFRLLFPNKRFKLINSRQDFSIVNVFNSLFPPREGRKKFSLYFGNEFDSLELCKIFFYYLKYGHLSDETIFKHFHNIGYGTMQSSDFDKSLIVFIGDCQLQDQRTIRSKIEFTPGTIDELTLMMDKTLYSTVSIDPSVPVDVIINKISGLFGFKEFINQDADSILYRIEKMSQAFNMVVYQI